MSPLAYIDPEAPGNTYPPGMSQEVWLASCCTPEAVLAWAMENAPEYVLTEDAARHVARNRSG